MGKEECRLSSSINLILFVDLFFPEDFLMKLEGKRNLLGGEEQRNFFHLIVSE